MNLQDNDNGGELDPASTLFDSLVEAFDEASASGQVPAVLDAPLLSDDMRAELAEMQACVALLNAAALQGALTPLMNDPSMLPPPGAELDPTPNNDGLAGERIGRFELVRELGRGGYGVVFLAHDPRLQRDVALKVPRPEALVSPELRKRFLREAQASARLKHPHLLPVYEIDEDGALCYLVTQYCRGPSLAEWLRTHPLPVPVRDAAKVVADLADALDHAHHHGVLHRDIKPSNVLLDVAEEFTDVCLPVRPLPLSVYVAKLTDFGLAKVLDLGEEETRTGAPLGTPAYMSPEQGTGRLKEIGPASDIYSTGVILYELLTHRPPFVGQSQAETLQQIVTNDPVAPGRLRAGLPRDLEAICLRCLEKRPSNRYASAADLAADLRRFLAGEPTRARPLRPAQRVWKWAVRRPGIATLAATVLLLLVTLATGSAIAAVRMARLAESEHAAALAAIEARDRAEEASRKAQAEVESRRQVSKFLTNLLEVPDTIGISGFGLRRPSDSNKELTAKEMLTRGEERLKHELADQPLVRAQLLNTIGNVFVNLGEVDKGEPLLMEALSLQRSYSAPPLELAETLHNLTMSRHLEGRFDEGITFAREALRIRQNELAADDLLVASAAFNLAWVLADSSNGRHVPEAEALFQTALDIRRKHLHWNDREMAISLSSMAAMRLQARDVKGALPYLIQAALIFMQQPGGEKLGLAVGRFQAALVWRQRKRYKLAEEQYRAAIDQLMEYFQGDHPAIALALGDLAGMLKEAREFEKGEPLALQAIEMGRRLSPRGHPQLVIALCEVGEAWSTRGKHEEALQFLQEAREMARQVFGDDSTEEISATIRFANAQLNKGDTKAAVETMRACFDQSLYITDPSTNDYKTVRINLAEMLQADGQFDEAEWTLRDLLAANSEGGEFSLGPVVLIKLASVLNEREPGNAEAEELSRRAVSIVRRGGVNIHLSIFLREFGQILFDRGQYAECEAIWRESLIEWEKTVASYHYLIHDGKDRLGACLAAQAKYAEAEPLLLAGLEGLRISRGPKHRDTITAIKRLASLYKATGQTEKLRELEQSATN
jgi:tetratricopeptide (TPR) repeat protein/tRNA A-37 threonylcarbamoyl transferase component Bud32